MRVKPSGDCERWRGPLLRAAYDDAPVAGGLRRHLAVCEPCAAELASNRAALARLESALRPEQPTGAFLDDLRRRLRAVQPAAPAAAEMPGWRLVATAAAAALLLAIYLPASRFPVPSAPVAGYDIALSPQDEQAIADSYVRLRWESHLQPRVESLRVQVEALTDQVTSGSSRLLPWSERDDWDVPPEGGGRSAGPVAPVEVSEVYYGPRVRALRAEVDEPDDKEKS